MQWQYIVFAMLPAVAFAVLVGRVALRTTVTAVTLLAALEFVLNSALLGLFEPFSFASLLLFAIFGTLALRRDEGSLVMLQPVALEIALGFVFLAAVVIFDTPLFGILLEQYVGFLEVVPAYQDGYFAQYARTMSTSIPFLLFLHAGLLYLAWRQGALRTWILARTLGLHVLVVALFFAERLLIEPA